MSMRWKCPHCNSPLRIRSSKQPTPLFREAYVQCRNDDCSWSAKLAIEVTHTLSPSAHPNQNINTELSPELEQWVRARNAELERHPKAH